MVQVFRSDCSTKEVYEKEAKDVALSVVSGINSSVFAYGQTSSGKTFTMMGITKYAVAYIYYYIEKHNEREFLLKFSAMEIYNESVRDLLSIDSTPLRLLDDPENFVDLEGSERTSQSLSAGTRLKAGCHINRSLLTLGTIIRKLSKGRNGQVPLRDSKLTHILQSSLGDNATTSITCTMGPQEVMLSNQEIRYCLQDLLQLVGDEEHSMTQVGFNNYPHLQVRKSPECENPVPNTSPLASPHSLDIGFRSVNRYLYSYGHSGRSSDDHYIQILPEFEENFVPNDTSPQLLAEDLCREVRCIEAEESNRSSSPEQNTKISESMVARNGDAADHRSGVRVTATKGR
ncbi:Kinesin-like protein KIN-7I [Camellia lanceoleosa]|uniref:Kinesin-like protein KIN-7I n=1 Tax=Camellia lanceoleosa TaxID=1840588 RepID=A0ACC0HXB9_9ERIC|nr:Kinesin-like protein KIN-7I [Camellia lanceoleosa]